MGITRWLAARLSGRGSTPKRIFFTAMSGNHIRIFADTADEIRKRGFTVHFVCLKKYVSTVERIEALGFPVIGMAEAVEMSEPGDVALIAVDWGPVQARFVETLKRNRVRAVGMIEACRYGLEERYTLIEEVLVWGPAADQYFDIPSHIVGFPVVERTLALQTNTVKPPRALINFKFTYADADADPEGFWLTSAIEACEQAGLAHTISSHPRNEFDPDGHEISPHPIETLFDQSTLLITRSSNVLFEGLACGLDAILYPIPGEPLAELADPMGAYEIAQSTGELVRFVSEKATNGDANADRAKRFLDTHLSIDPDRPAFLRMADVIEAISKR